MPAPWRASRSRLRRATSTAAGSRHGWPDRSRERRGPEAGDPPAPRPSPSPYAGSVLADTPDSCAAPVVNAPTVRVIVPWRPSPSRMPAFEFLGAWYAKRVPEFAVRTHRHRRRGLQPPACRNLGIGAADPTRSSSSTTPTPCPSPRRCATRSLPRHKRSGASALRRVPLARGRGHGAVSRREPSADCDFELVRRAARASTSRPTHLGGHGGQDERFRGWGFEDAAWYVAHETLLGEAPGVTGCVYAMHHETQLREGRSTTSTPRSWSATARPQAKPRRDGSAGRGARRS